MHNPSILVATAAILATAASVQAERPKFYFPRQVKRQFANTTSTPKEIKQNPFTFSSSSTKRDTDGGLSGFLNGLTTGNPPDTTGTGLDDVFSGLVPTAAASDDDDGGVTTVIVKQTTVVPPADPTTAASTTDGVVDPLLGSTGVLPSVIVLPTTSDSTTDPIETIAPTSTESGITFGPDGIVTSTTDEPTATDTTVDSLTSGLSFSGTGGTTAPTNTATDLPDFLSIISQVSSVIAPDPTETSATVDPTTTPDPATTADPTTTAAETSDLLSSIVSGVTDILPTPTPTITSGVTGPATTGDATITTETPLDPTTPAPTSLGLSEILSSILDPATTDLPPITTPTDSPTVTIPPITTPTDSPTLPPITTPTDIPTGNVTVTDPPITTPTGSTTLPPITTPTAIPTGNGTVTDTPITTPTVSTGIVTASPTNGTKTTPSGSLPTVTPPTNGTAPDTQPLPTSLPGSATVTEPPVLTTPTAVFPTGTDTGTSMWLPPLISVASSPILAPGGNPTALPTGIPSGLPTVIQAPNNLNGTLEAPEGMVLVQLSFLFDLNWEWVAMHSVVAAQIFSYLPPGLTDGLKLKEDEVAIQQLLPLDVSSTLGYVKTRAMTFIPQNMFDTLALSLKTPVSTLYANQDPSVFQLMNYLDPAVPLQPGVSLDGSAATGTGTGSSPTGDAGGKNGVFDTNNSQNTTPAVRSTTAGIAMGCVGAAAAYGAAMFFIARRYKRRKTSHRRSSSIMSNSEMRQSGSPPLLTGSNQFMSGGRTSPGGTNNDRNSRGSGRSAGNSARTQQISAPMMAENSLGWN